MIGVWSYTVILTYVGLISAVVGISYSALYMAGTVTSLLIPICCLLFSGFCDMFDGRIARTKKNRTDREKNFGIEIDSLCDDICFGMQPAMIVFAISENKYLGIVAAAALVLAGIVRLAYFNVIEMERRSDPNNDDHSYMGLPITTSAIIFPILYLIYTLVGESVIVAFPIVGIITAILDITPFKLKKPGTKVVYLMAVLGIATGIYMIVVSKIS